MPRALFRVQGELHGQRETSFATPKKVGNIEYWWKSCRKTWPDLPEEYTEVKITTESITFRFTMTSNKTGRIYINREHKFGD
jgi:hypothetical protein